MLPPKITLNAQTYAWEYLKKIAGAANLNISYLYGLPNNQSRNARIVILPASPQTWNQLVSLPPHTIEWLPAESFFPPNYPRPFNDPLPVLFWGKKNDLPIKRHADGTVTFYVDIISTTLFMLTRWEEIVISKRDQHQRFPATSSVAYKQGFLDRPIVDEYALVLQAWLKVLMPNWPPEKYHFTVKISHDIDYVRSLNKPLSILRSIKTELAQKNPYKIKQLLQGVLHPEKDPFYLSINQLANISEQTGFRSAFYFMTANPSRFDSGYDLSTPFIYRCIKDLMKRGHEIGFHAGYNTFNNPNLFAKEKERLQEILRIKEFGGRQHYLRFQVPSTWYIWEKEQMKYDSTLGYADYEGFRAGTCHPFPPFDLKQNRIINLHEVPLIAMDGTLKSYRKLSPLEAKKRILLLAQRCKRVHGTFTLLWHNTSLVGNWQSWAKIYPEIINELSLLAV